MVESTQFHLFLAQTQANALYPRKNWNKQTSNRQPLG